jgi:hypothetical protein
MKTIITDLPAGNGNRAEVLESGCKGILTGK